MAKARTTDRPLENRERLPASGTRMRIDRAHQPLTERERAAAEAEDASVLAAAGLSEEMSEEQVLAQAAQLAGNLQERLRELDRREHAVHANAAKIEAEMRSARLWVADREAAIYDQEQEMQRREEALRERDETARAECESLERSLAARELRIAQDETAVRQREEQIAARLSAIEDEAAGLEAARRNAHAERVQLEEQLRDDYRKKHAAAEEAMTKLADDRAAVVAERETMLAEIAAEREQLAAQVAAERTAVAAQLDAERTELANQVRAEREALLLEMEKAREEDQRRLDKHQIDLLADVERQRQELFELREQLNKNRAVFEQERSVWVVAQTGGDPKAFDLAQERLQLEKDRSNFLAERRKHDAKLAELTLLAENQTQEIDRLKRHLAHGSPGAAAVLTASAQQPTPSAINFTAGGSGSLLEIAEQQARLDQATIYLEREAEELDTARTRLEQDQAEWRRIVEEQRKDLERREQTLDGELESRRKKLAHREQTLDQQLASVEQTRQEILRVHRESLEMRLVAEELWAQVAGRVPPAEVTQAIANLRSRLANQYRVENKQLAARKQQIVELSERLEQQQEALARQRRELQAWAAARQVEIEEQAKRLVTREVELDQQHKGLQEQSERLDGDRRKLAQDQRRITGFEKAPA